MPTRRRETVEGAVRPDAADRQRLLVAWGGGVLALAVAVALFSRFSIDGNLWRDESIYAYGGQQLAHGVPVYVSIFDPKTPLGTILAGLGALGGGWFGVNDVHAMRLEFFLFACLAVVAVYQMGLWLWKSPLAGIVSAVAFASFRGFAVDALEGPDAKTPGVFLAVLSMALLVRRHWFWGAFAGSLAFLVWQPLAIYAAVAVVWALLASDADQRWKHSARALAGAAIPIAATTLYFWIVGALSQFVETAFVFPLTGVQRGNETLASRLDRIVYIVNRDYGNTRVLFWGGLVLLVALLVVWLVRGRSHLRGVVREPYVGVVIATFLGIAAFTLSDFQGYPDLYPLLPYAAVGLGGAVALVEHRIDGVRLRRAATAVSLAGVAILVGLSWSWYSGHHGSARSLTAERSDAATLKRILDPGETLYALGDPTPLVLTRRRNPSKYIYLGSGIGAYVIHHTPGGIDGWKARIRASDPAVVVINSWNSPAADNIRTWLRSTYGTGIYLGNWLLFVKPAVRERAARRGIAL
jgi:4-amino-4-deoxy-L-arabinose transferase-like glycosyltransferase